MDLFPLIVDPNDRLIAKTGESGTSRHCSKWREWIMADFTVYLSVYCRYAAGTGRYNGTMHVCIASYDIAWMKVIICPVIIKRLICIASWKGRHSLFKRRPILISSNLKMPYFNSEVIMAVSCDETADGTNKSGNFNPLMMLLLLMAARSGRSGQSDSFLSARGRDEGQTFNVSPKFWDTYDPSDKRRDVIWLSVLRQPELGLTGIQPHGTVIINKFPVEAAATFQGTDIPLARWADVLLMYAEAEVRKNKCCSVCWHICCSEWNYA